MLPVLADPSFALYRKVFPQEGAEGPEETYDGWQRCPAERGYRVV
jgi:hypothetical protein